MSIFDGILSAITSTASGQPFLNNPTTPPPDPTATANAQIAVNNQSQDNAALLNQINQSNPFGTLSYSGDIGSPDRTQTVTLDPQLQQLLNTQEGNANSLATASGNLINATGNINPFNPGANTTQAAQGAGPLQTSFDSGPGIQSTVPQAGGLTTGVNASPIQQNLNTSGVQQIQNPSSYQPEINQQTNAAYQSQTGLLQPGFDQATNQLKSQLAAQGIDQNSPAYTNALANLQRSQGSTLQQAAASATQQGLAAQGQLYGENLAGSTEQFNQAATQGQYGLSAQGQQFNQGATNAQLNNSAQGQLFGENLSAGQFANQAAGQQFSQNAAQAQFANQAQTQDQQNNIALQNAQQALYQQNYGNAQSTQTQNINAIQAMNNAQQIAPNSPAFNPYATTTAAQSAPNIAGLAASNFAAQQQASASANGALYGAAGTAAAALICWVAREVYGESNPRWLKVREWMLTKAPKELLDTYIEYGPRIAEYIRNKPELKTAIHTQMEAVLGC